MAEMEEVTILRVNTLEAVKNVGDLKQNIKDLKSALDTLDIGSQEYQETLNELKVNQNALKDAMYGTTSSLDDVKAAALGVSETYNGLVHRMAAYKEELRNTDISTEEGAKRFRELADKINETNDKLKALDAMQGNFQRNVGNYPMKMSEGFKSAAEAIGGPFANSVGKADKLMKGMAANPLMLTLGLLAGLISSIVAKVKESEGVTKSVREAGISLKPVLDGINWVIEKIGDWIGNVIEKMAEWVSSSNGSFKNIVAGVIGVGNAILQYLLAPVKTAVEAFKGLGSIVKDIFTGQWGKIKEDAENAFNGIKDAFKDGFSFKSNYEEGQAIAEQMFQGISSASTKKKAKDTGKAIGASVAEGINEAVEEGFKFPDIDKILAEQERAREEARRIREEEEKAFADEMEAETAALNADIEKMFEDMARQEEEAKKKEEEIAKARIDTLFSVASATSSVLGSIADMYEENAEESADAARRVKGIRIAAATIDTISGAIGAFMQAAESIPAPYGMIIGAVEAAAVTAAGIANIAKMRSTNISSGGSSSPSVGATVSAPAISTNIPQTSIVNSNSQQDMLNQMASSQKVYILQSDIEAAGNASRARVAESSY